MSSLAADFGARDAEDDPAGSGPGLTPAGVVASARSLAGALVSRQQETEERTFYAPEIHHAFAEAGLYRILTPRRYGGLEFGADTFFRVCMALARGCPSTGWMYTLGAAHALAAATIFPPEAQDELFEDGDFIAPATIMPSGSAHRADENDGWIVSGTWNYCSGAPYATHFIGHAPVSTDGSDGSDGENKLILFIAPRRDWRRLDDWGQQLGLRGSGSHSIVLDNVWIPDRFVLDGHISDISITANTPGVQTHANPQYGGGLLSFMNLESSALAIGMAQGALDACEDLMRSRMTLFPPVVPRTHDVDYQYWYGEATGLIATAEAALLDATHQWQEACDLGPAAFDREFELRIAMISRQVTQMAWRAVEQYLLPTAGSSAVIRGQRLERVWRDMSMQHTHAGFAVFLAAKAQRELARAHFGIDDHKE